MAEGLPHAIIGAFALNEYGHRRITVDVDLVMRDEDLQAFKRSHLGGGYARAPLDPALRPIGRRLPEVGGVSSPSAAGVVPLLREAL